MSHYEIDFSRDLEENPAKARRLAINESIRYAGVGVMKNTLRAIWTGQVNDLKHLRFLLGMLVGIKGYPVKAIYEYATRGKGVVAPNPKRQG
jgi:hypothetical protein